MAEIKIEGMQALLDKLTELGRKGRKIENQALLKAAQPILDDAASTNVFKDGSGKGRKGLKISRPKSKGDTKYVLIGIEKNDISEIYYMKFLEFGTSKMPARPFLGPAYIRNRSKAIQILKNEFRKGLGLQ